LSHCHLEWIAYLQYRFQKIKYMYYEFLYIYTILVTFGSETPELTLLTITSFATIR